MQQKMQIYLINPKGKSETERVEAGTFELACKSLGLNPVDCECNVRLPDGNWLKIENKKENMKNGENPTESQPPASNATMKARQPRSDKGSHHVTEKPVTASHRRKGNITVEDINTIYYDGKTYWKLAEFQPEPIATMVKLDGGLEPKTGPLSEFNGFYRCKVEYPRKKIKEVK